MTTSSPTGRGAACRSRSPLRVRGSARVVHRPRLLSDNVAGDFARWLEGKGIAHIRGAPNHPQTQGKIGRWHQTLKNRMVKSLSDTLKRTRQP